MSSQSCTESNEPKRYQSHDIKVRLEDKPTLIGTLRNTIAGKEVHIEEIAKTVIYLSPMTSLGRFLRHAPINIKHNPRLDRATI